MKYLPIIIFLMLIVVITSCEKAIDNDKYKPDLKVIYNSSRIYDIQKPLDTFRISGNIKLNILIAANGFTNAYIENLQITDFTSGQVLLDTSVNNAKYYLNLDLGLPSAQTDIYRTIRVFDHIGNTTDTVLHFYVVDKGILGTWHINKQGIAGGFQDEDIQQVDLYFQPGGEYSMQYWDGTNQAHVTKRGTYYQQKKDDVWSINLHQYLPDTVDYEGLFQVIGEKKDSIVVQMVQTKPDIGLMPPDEINIKSNFANGEYFHLKKNRNTGYFQPLQGMHVKYILKPG